MDTKEKTLPLQFIPYRFLNLTKVKKIKYKGINLKTDYIINMMNELLNKYYTHKEDLIDKEIYFNISSVIFRERYGTKYNYYINYLIEYDFIIMVSDYYRSKKARTYKLNINDLINIKRCKISDNILLKKQSPEYLRKQLVEKCNSPIPVEIRRKLVDNLYDVQLDVDGSVEYLNNLKEKNEISINKYYKNLMSIENVSTSNLYFKFDEFGRLHTNFTVLKKHIREKFIKIDNLEITEVDIKNSQPLFLTILMKKEMSLNKLIQKDVTNYIELVEKGLIYEQIMKHCNIDNREDVKKMIYIVLFGQNGDGKKENNMFKNMFPNVFEFIKDYKTINNNYKSLSHKLQLLESDFIYNKVIKHIMNTYPHIKMFTVHDSICYPKKYENEVTAVFNYYKRKILE